MDYEWIDARLLLEVGRGSVAKSQAMTTQEIQKHVDAAMGARFGDITAESGEVMTSEGGDGRFFGKVTATLYAGMPDGQVIYLAIGQSEKLVQIVKFGRSECLKPSEADLDLILLKELGKSEV